MAIEQLTIIIEGISATGGPAEIGIESFSWGLSIAANDAGGGRPQFTELQLTRLVDQFSPTLYHSAQGGTHLGIVSIYCRKAGGDPTVTIVYTLSDVHISSYTNGGNQHAGLPVEGISLHFGKLDFSFIDKVS